MIGLKADQKPPLLISAVVAMAANRVIGDGAGLIWHLPDDLKRVKLLTMGCPLIMGRKTWQSIGRPLPGRCSIVLTRDLNWQAECAVAVHDFEAALVAADAWIAAHNPNCEKIILFGGGEIYGMGLDFCHQIDLTVIDISPDGGPNAALFPELDEAGWTRHIEAIFDPVGDVPGYRYECWYRPIPPRTLPAVKRTET